MIPVAASYFESSRRFTGPNRYFDQCGAVIEVLAASARQCLAWERHVRTMRALLGWPDAAVVASVYASGASLAFAAPEDQLFTATEVNEWAWQNVASADASLPLPQAPGHPATWDHDSAIHTLRKLAAAESRPAIIALLEAAERHGVASLLDDDALSVGAGEGSRTWPLDSLPGVVEWAGVHDIPTVLVTGSNGKTTTTRLLAAMFGASGLRAGFNCTDGVFIDGATIERGDFSGPAGARQVLRDRRVQAAILETARGGILRRGLAVRHADAAIVTNLSPDHYGEYGVHGLTDLAEAKLVVARVIDSEGTLVLNADDAVLMAQSASLKCRLAWFAADHSNAFLQRHRLVGGATCGVAQGRLLLHFGGIDHDLGEAAAMPLTCDGLAEYNIANICGAALVAGAMKLEPAMIAKVLAVFGRDHRDNPGRLQRWRIAGMDVLLDYAHNPEGLAGLLAIGQGLRRRSGGRMGLLLGQAGNRDDVAVRALAAVAAAARPDMVVLKDLEGYLRGRERGEVPAVLRDELLRCGQSADSIRCVLSEVDAALALLDSGKAGDVLVMPVHNLQARDLVVALLNDRAEAGGEIGAGAAPAAGSDGD